MLRPLYCFELSAEIILFIFLVTLVYESSQGMDVRELHKNLAPILILAFPVLLISTLLVEAVPTFFISLLCSGIIAGIITGGGTILTMAVAVIDFLIIFAGGLAGR
jgi:CPA1 family monovalent cation:H+ antiporter